MLPWKVFRKSAYQTEVLDHNGVRLATLNGPDRQWYAERIVALNNAALGREPGDAGENARLRAYAERLRTDLVEIDLALAAGDIYEAGEITARHVQGTLDEDVSALAATARPAPPAAADQEVDEIPHRRPAGAVRVTGKVGAVRRGVPIIHPDDVQDDPRDQEIERLRATLTDRQRYIHAERHVDERGYPIGVWTDCGQPTCWGTRTALAAAPPAPVPVRDQEIERLTVALAALAESSDRLLRERDQYMNRLGVLLPTLNTAQVAASVGFMYQAPPVAFVQPNE